MLAVFRADADETTGGGHVVRCSALALEFKRRGWRNALAAHGSAATMPFAAAAFDELYDLEETHGARHEAAQLRQRWPDGCAVAVIDHYRRDVGFEAALRPWARRTLAIDDLADRRHDSDFLLDASPDRSIGDYAPLVPDRTELLIGPEFALLRPDFPTVRAARLPRDGVPKLFRVLVMFGATDCGGLSFPVAAALAASGLPIELEVVIGPSATAASDLERLAARAPVPIALIVGAADMAQRMAAADVAIGGAGTSSWERCSVGLPSLVIVLAENQRDVARSLVNHGAAEVLGSAAQVSAARVASALADLITDADRLRAMSRSAAALCDGQGAARVADVITGRDR
jgi:UDP-2,4-diacetamido-2,4,6-trideoxy-beta-L-altropyranose hydrolase